MVFLNALFGQNFKDFFNKKQNLLIKYNLEKLDFNLYKSEKLIINRNIKESEL